MSVLTVYTFLSHDCRILPAQLECLARHLTSKHDVTVVQGPFGDYGMTSAGPLRLGARQAKTLRVTVATVPDSLAGLVMPLRYLQICRWLWQSRIRQQSPRYALLMHGDLLPTETFDAPALLDGHPVAGRLMHDDLIEPYVPLTWLAVDLDRCRQVPDMFPDMRTRNKQWCGLQIKGWGDHLMTQADVERRIGPNSARYYQDRMRFEWCEPAFMHVDKLSTVGASGPGRDLFESKLKVIENLAPGKIESMCRKLNGLENHAPRTGTMPPPPRAKVSMQPGDLLALAIKCFTFGRVRMCAGCNTRRKKLNTLGWRGCFAAINPMRLINVRPTRPAQT